MSNQNEVPPHFIVFVPGYLGSKLRDKASGKTWWVDFSSIPLNPLEWDAWLSRWIETLKYPNEQLEPSEILDHVLYVPPWIKMEGYAPLLDGLEAMGYRANPKQHAEKDLDVYTFPYDWRQDNRISGRQLGAAIERWSAFHPGAKAVIIAHSNGGVVARWYIEKEGGKDRVSRLFLMGAPRDGTPLSMYIVIDGFDALLRRGFNLFDIPHRSRDMFRTFPSIYQIIPVRDQFLHGTSNEPIDFVNDSAHWLDDERQRQLVLDARRFNDELGTQLSVETLCFFGRKRYTYTGGVVHVEPGGHWNPIDWTVEAAGDGTIPERSAVYPEAKKQLAYPVDHGHIYYDPAVLSQIEWELLGQYQNQPERAFVATQRLTISFEPDRDFYAPGELINMRATLHRKRDDSPVSDATINAQLIWRQALPGSIQTAPSANPPMTRLSASRRAGDYAGSLAAPQAEGYYRLQALVKVPAEPTPIQLEELIAVEHDTDDLHGFHG